MLFGFFLSSRRRHTRCALVTGVQTCALPIYPLLADWPADWRAIFCGGRRSGLLKRALQRMLMLAREVDHLGHLGLGDLVAERPADAHAALVDVEHDAGRVLQPHAEKALKHQHDELHRSIRSEEHTSELQSL